MGKVYHNVNQELVRAMIRIYKPNGLDWMSYQITNHNILTFHHIIKKEQAGRSSLENGALLTQHAHRHLNMLETRDYGLYLEWTALFQDINRHHGPITEQNRKYSQELKKYTQKVLYRK